VAAVLSGIALLSAIFVLPESLQAGSAPAERHWLDVRGLRDAVARPSIGVILFTMFLTTFAFAQFESTLSRLTQELGLADRYNFYVFAYIGLVLAISQGVLVRRLIPRLGEFKMGLAGTVLMVLGLGLIGVAGSRQSTRLLYAVLPICVIGFSALTPSLQALLSLRSPAGEQGGILGLGQSMAALARILGPLAGMILFERRIDYPYWGGAALMAMGLLLILALRPTKQHQSDALASEKPSQETN
jgi:MFS family permease